MRLHRPVFLAVLSLSLGVFASCGDEGEPCSSDADCTDPCSVCGSDEQLCVPRECPSGQTCDPDQGACVPEGEVTQCDTSADCYEEVAFCDPSSGACAGVTCGAASNSCSLCTSGSTHEASGPVLYGAEQNGDCLPPAQAMAVCSGGKLCEFTVSYEDESPGEVGGSGIGSRLEIVTLGGMVTSAADVPVVDGSARTITFVVCYQESTEPRGAVFVEDTEGNASNTLCFGAFP